MGKTKRRREPKAASGRRKRNRVIAAVVVLMIVALFGGLILPGLLEPPRDPGDPNSYFPARMASLKKPEKALSDNLVVGINSWETAGSRPPPQPQVRVSPAAGSGDTTSTADVTPTVSPRRATPSPSPPKQEAVFFIGIENKHSSKSIVIADILIDPALPTAPGARLEKSKFVETEVAPGEKIQVEVPLTVIKDPKRVPPTAADQVKPEDYGVALAVVAAFKDSAPDRWREQTHPEDASGFREAWSAFAWMAKFVEIPPGVLFITAR
jgi:hypothetical protein